MNQLIPKVIHYCWMSNDPLIGKYEYCMNSWKRVLKDYEFKLWNLNNFDINAHRFTKTAFKKKKYAFVADYIRLYALYNEGGIYLDCDVVVFKNFDEFLHLPYAVCFEVPNNSIEAAIMMFEPHHPILKKILDYYDQIDYKDNQEPIPNVIRNIVLRNYNSIKQIDQIVESYDSDPKIFNVFEKSYFSPIDWSNGPIHSINNHHTYCAHLFANSWMPHNRIKFDNIFLIKPFLHKI